MQLGLLSDKYTVDMAGGAAFPPDTRAGSGWKPIPRRVLGLVVLMTVVWSRVYYAPLFGIGGVIILASFFSIVWLWMKKVVTLDKQERTASEFKLVGYLFWMNATWFLCGETGKLHLKAFAGDPAPSPIEIMVFLVLGWLFVLVGEYIAARLKKS